MRLEDLNLSDSKISMMHVDVINKRIVINFEFAFDLRNKKSIPNIEVIIKDWKAFKQYKYVSFDDYVTYDRIDIDLTKDFETFYLIQEVLIDVNNIVFRGYSKESSNWLVYDFNNPIVVIRGG